MSEGQATPASTMSTKSSEEQPTSPPSSSDGPDDTELPAHGAPKVRNPIDVSRFEEDPCLALTASQAQELNVPHPGEPYDSPGGKSCGWGTAGAHSGQASIGFISEDPTGLSSTYLSNERGEFAFFEPLDELSGFPAAAFGVRDARAQGQCAISVGVTDQLQFIVSVTLSGANIGIKDACQEGAKVTVMMLQTMKDS